MKSKRIILASMALLLASGVGAQEKCVEPQNDSEMKNKQQTEQQEEKKVGFFRRAFRDMKESARLQHKIDKANYEATKLETKAFYQEQKRLSKPSVRSAAERERMELQLQEANRRKEEAQAKLDSIRNR